MKVLLTTDTVGGVWTYAIELSRALGRHGVDVVLATMGPPLGSGRREEVAALGNVDVHESAFRLEWMPEPWADVQMAGDWLLELEARTAPDVVHLNQYAHGVLPWRAPTVVVAHSCVLSWWCAVRGEAAPPAWNRYRDAVTAGLDAAGLIVAPSQAMLAAVEAHYAPRGPRTVVYNGCAPQRVAPGGKTPIVLSLGRLWDEAKNVAAVGHVAGDLPWPVYVAGDTANPGGGAAELGGARHLGRLSPAEVRSWLGRASIYAAPARYEPFGLSILEAALAGCALVLGDIPSLHEIWHGDAVFVQPQNDAALAEALRHLIEDPGRRARLAARARRRALTFTAERMALAYLAAYAGLRGAAPDPEEASACVS
jgi:glycogen synthase